MMAFHQHHPSEVPGVATGLHLTETDQRLMTLIRATQDRVAELEARVAGLEGRAMLPAAEIGATTPSKGYVLDTAPPDWWTLGAAIGPCGCTLPFNVPLEELVKLTALHACERQEAGHG